MVVFPRTVLSESSHIARNTTSQEKVQPPGLGPSPALNLQGTAGEASNLRMFVYKDPSLGPDPRYFLEICDLLSIKNPDLHLGIDEGPVSAATPGCVLQQYGCVGTSCLWV